MITLALLLSLFVPQSAQAAPDYAGIYAQGIPYGEFLAGVTARADGWRSNSASAAIPDATAAQVKNLPDRRKLLVVTEASCSDSVSTVPYIARLVELAPDRLEMRLVNSKIGRAVMDAHRTPDGRAATPTVIVLDADGKFLAAWIERPVPLQKWHAEQKVANTTRALLPAKMKWYEEDAGASTISELVALLTGAS